jgi:hypothetical protein
MDNTFLGVGVQIPIKFLNFVELFTTKSPRTFHLEYGYYKQLLLEIFIYMWMISLHVHFHNSNSCNVFNNLHGAMGETNISLVLNLMHHC